MVNFRYHIVSLVAVFLALGIGILMGTTAIDQGLVTRLRSQTSGLEGRLAGLQDQNDDLQRRQSVWDAYGRSALLPVLKDRLKGRTIVLVAEDGADTKLIDGLSSALGDAGATLAGRIATTSRWTLKDDAARQAFAIAADVEPAATGPLLTAAAQRLGARLAASSDPTKPSDLLSSMRAGGYLTVDPTNAGSFPPPGAVLVVVPSGERDAKPPQDQFFMPLLRAIAVAGRGVVVAEPLSSADSLAERVRSDANLRSAIASVDDADLILGRVAVISAIRSITTGLGAQQYGARRSATALVPASP
jgi:hypothetical protein